MGAVKNNMLDDLFVQNPTEWEIEFSARLMLLDILEDRFRKQLAKSDQNIKHFQSLLKDAGLLTEEVPTNG